MAALIATHPTLLDLKARMDDNGSIAPIIEILDQNNDILDDMVWIEGNQTTGHKTTMRSGIPEPIFRKLYGGVQPTKSRTLQIIDNCGMLESYAEIDKALADLNGNTAEWRLSEEIPFIEGFNQKLSRYAFYGNEATEPEAFTGLAPRFNDQAAVNGENILTSAATPDSTDNASIWLVVWGPNTCHGIYPKGSYAGLQSRDLGEHTLFDAAGGRYQGYRTHYKWDLGLTLRDWRYAVRIANIDVSDLTKNASAGADLIDLLTQAVEITTKLGMGRATL